MLQGRGGAVALYCPSKAMGHMVACREVLAILDNYYERNPLTASATKSLKLSDPPYEYMSYVKHCSALAGGAEQGGGRGKGS